MSDRYAEGTKVAVTKSLAEIEDLVRKRGGQKFYRGEQDERMVLGWWQSERMVMFGVTMPPLKQFERKPRGYGTRPLPEQRALQEQAMREQWRAVLLVIKAKYASVDAKIETFEESFLGQLVVPDPETGRPSPYARIAIKAIADVYTGGTMKQLGAGGAP
ncbi:MAG: hypothetical protein Q8K32_10945 [Archangium sp.]|nr:hypothetical protein [Archangium sp.]